MKILLECERGGEFYSVSRVRSAIHGSGLQVPAASRLVRTISFGIPWGLAFGCIIKENKLLQVSLWCQLSCVIDVCTNTAECQSSARIAQNRREINGTVCCEFSSANIWYKCFASVHFRSVKDFEKNAQSVAVCACPHFKCTTVIDVYDPCFLNSDWFSPKPLSQWGSFSGLVVSLTSSKLCVNILIGWEKRYILSGFEIDHLIGSLFDCAYFIVTRLWLSSNHIFQVTGTHCW